MDHLIRMDRRTTGAVDCWSTTRALVVYVRLPITDGPATARAQPADALADNAPID
jgi:hypothetical protein